MTSTYVATQAFTKITISVLTPLHCQSLLHAFSYHHGPDLQHRPPLGECAVCIPPASECNTHTCVRAAAVLSLPQRRDRDGEEEEGKGGRGRGVEEGRE